MIEDNLVSNNKDEIPHSITENKQYTYECVMNTRLIFNKEESFISYTCTTCPGKPDNICYLCMQNCHKNHVTNWKNVKERKLNIKTTQCSCALRDHKVFKQYTRFDEIRTDNNEMQCTLNEVIYESNVKHFYIDPISHMYYCLYCLDACQGVLNEALEDYIKREKSKFSQGAPLCSCSNKESHSPFTENIVSLANFILSPVYDKVINRVQLPGQIYSKPSLCEKYLDPIKIAHATISKDLKEKNFEKYKAETLSKSYVSCLELLKSSAEILKKDTNLITNPNIQIIYNIDFLMEIFSSNFFEDFSLIDTKIYTLYFFRKFYLLPMVKYKKWHDGYTDFDNTTPFHRLIFRSNIEEFFTLSKIKKGVLKRLLDRIHLYIYKYFEKIDESQFSKLVIEYLKWLILLISYKYDTPGHEKENKKMYNDIIAKFLQIVDLVAVKKSFENVLKKYFEIFLVKVMLFTNDEILWNKLMIKKQPGNRVSIQHQGGNIRSNVHEDNSQDPLQNKSHSNIEMAVVKSIRNPLSPIIGQSKKYVELQEEEDEQQHVDLEEENNEISAENSFIPNLDDMEDDELDQDKNTSKEDSKKFFFENGDFQLNLIKALFAFGKADIDVSEEINTGELYDMLVNDKDYYYQTIKNFTDSNNSKSNLEILIQINNNSYKLSKEEEKYINLLKGNINFLLITKKKFYEAHINEKELIECTINVFEVTLKYLASIILTDYVSNSGENSEQELETITKNNFKIQIHLLKIGFFDALLNMWYILTSNEFICNTVEPNNLNSCLAEILKNFLFMCYDNPFISAFMLNNHILNVLFEYKYDAERDYIVKSFYLEVMKIVSKTKQRLNFLNFVSHLNSSFNIEKLNSEEFYQMDPRNLEFEEKKINIQLSIYKKILKISSLKTLAKINDLIGCKITQIISTNYYVGKLEKFKLNLEEIDDITRNFIMGVFKNINGMEDSYFSLLAEYVNISDIDYFLSYLELDPIARRIFTITYSKYYAESPFKIFDSLNKKALNQFRRNIDFNLRGKFLILDEEFETEKKNYNSNLLEYNSFRGTEDNISMNYYTSYFNPEVIFLPLLTNMEKYKRIISAFSEDYFRGKMRFFVNYFTDVILFPSIFSIYKILYFSTRASAKYKYLTYRFIYLFMLCYKHFLTCITKNKELNLVGNKKRQSTDNLAFLSKFFDVKEGEDMKSSTIDFMLNVMEELTNDIHVFQTENFEPLKLEILMEKWNNYVKHFTLVKNVLQIKEKHEVEEEPPEDDLKEKKQKNFKNQEKSVLDLVISFIEEYEERKKDLDNNLLICLYQESTTEQIKKETLKRTIALDLLYRLEGREKSQSEETHSNNNNNYNIRDLTNPTTNMQTEPLNSSKLFSSNEAIADAIRNVYNIPVNNHNIQVFNYEREYISLYSENNSNLLETINKLFKANPDLWQSILTESCFIMKGRIIGIIRHELTYLIQFIFVKFHKLSKVCGSNNTEYKYEIYEFEKTYLLRIIEFFRLFCENHHKIYQTFFTKMYIQHGEMDLIEFILELPVMILNHSDYFKKKKMRGILKYFRQEEIEYFSDIADSVNNFLIELIQGSLADNFNYIASRKEFLIFYEYGYRFFDSIDTGEDYEKFSANFLRFINCYLEENTNSVENKIAIVKKFKPSKLLNVLFFSFKKLCYIYLVEKPKGKHEKVEDIKIDTQTIHAYNLTESVSKDLLKIFIDDESIRNHHLFILASAIYIFFKSSSFYKSGEKIKSLLNTLQKLSELEPDNIPEKNKQLTITKREVYNFFNTLIKEVEVSYKFNNQMEDIELVKYRDYFDDDFFEFEKFRKFLKTEVQGIQNVIYVVHPDSLFIETSDLVKFNEIAPFENFDIKLNYILEYYEQLYSFIQLRKFLASKHSKLLTFLFYLNYDRASDISILISIALNAFIVIISMVVDKKLEIKTSPNRNQIYHSSSPGHSLTPFGENNSNHQSEANFLLQEYGGIAVKVCSIVHLFVLLLLIINWMSFRVFKLKNFVYHNKSISLTTRIKKYMDLLFEKEIFPLVWIFAFGVLALLSDRYKFAYSLQLFAIFSQVPTMQTVIYSVIIRYKQFISATFVIIILMLLYSSLSFFWFRDEYYNSDIQENYCESYLQCFLHLITNGVRGGAGLGFPIKSIQVKSYYYEFIFEWIFYFSIMLIMLNVINGIIVDTFQALREQNNLKEDIRENVCYICSLNRSKFEIKGVSFNNHVEVEHNVLNYFYYLLKVQQTDEQELNSLDYQVLNNIRTMRTDFFPIKKALSLGNHKKEE